MKNDPTAAFAGGLRCVKTCAGIWVKFRNLALQKESKVEEGRLLPDPVHMLSQDVGFIKGESAFHLVKI